MTPETRRAPSGWARTPQRNRCAVHLEPQALEHIGRDRAGNKDLDLEIGARVDTQIDTRARQRATPAVGNAARIELGRVPLVARHRLIEVQRCFPRRPVSVVAAELILKALERAIRCLERAGRARLRHGGDPPIPGRERSDRVGELTLDRGGLGLEPRGKRFLLINATIAVGVAPPGSRELEHGHVAARGEASAAVPDTQLPLGVEWQLELAGQAPWPDSLR